MRHARRWDWGAEGYAYGANGDLATTDLPNGAVGTRTSDALNRLASIATTVVSTGTLVFSITYTRDLDGHVLIET